MKIVSRINHFFCPKRIKLTPLLSVAHDGIGHLPWLVKAVTLTNELLQNELFYSNIAAHQGFDMADTTPDKIAELIRNTYLKMFVHTYYASDKMLPIDGFDDHNNPGIIHLNLWTINRSIASLCNSLIHACIHAVNYYNDIYSFGHGDRQLSGKENTAPCRIGALAQCMLSVEAPIFSPWEHDPNQPLSASGIYSPEAVNDFTQSMWICC